MSHTDPLIQLRQVQKSYHTPAGDVPALKGVDLIGDRGEFIAVFGKSGAGKTTLANIITGIDQPSGGDVVINGTEIHRLGAGELDRWRGLNLGIVFQFFQLVPSLSLIQNVSMPMDFCGTYPLDQAEERARHLLEQVGLGDHAHKTPSEISGGQQQRVAIARALANNPPLIVADEPTGNLDSTTSEEILELFQGLVAEGKSLIVVSHDEAIAARASRVVQIADGRILADANRPAEIPVAASRADQRRR
jgi:ABC-type lipoprotein export system ATPase subunit